MGAIIETIRLLIGNLFHVLLVPLGVVAVSLCLQGSRIVHEHYYEQVVVRTCQGEQEVRYVRRQNPKPALMLFNLGTIFRHGECLVSLAEESGAGPDL